MNSNGAATLKGVSVKRVRGGSYDVARVAFRAEMPRRSAEYLREIAGEYIRGRTRNDPEGQADAEVHIPEDESALVEIVLLLPEDYLHRGPEAAIDMLSVVLERANSRERTDREWERGHQQWAEAVLQNVSRQVSA